MTPMTTARLALALAAAVLFGLGIRADSSPLRWAAMALLVAALLMRFFDRDREKK